MTSPPHVDSALDGGIAAFLAAHRTEASTWLSELVATASQAPDERAAQELVAQIATAEGLDAVLLDSDPDGDLTDDPRHMPTGLGYGDRPNCVVSLPGATGAPLVCNAHIDTVAVGNGWTRNPLGDMADGRFYGLGACDAKASTVAALLATSCLRSLGVEPSMPIELHSVIDEEPGGNGTLALVRRILGGELVRPDMVVVMEPSRLDVLNGHRGMLWHTVECTGVQTHGSGSGGVNAIEIAAEVVLRLRDLNERFATWSADPYLAPRVNVGIINGGHEVYTTPGGCRIEVSARYAAGQREMVGAALQSAVVGADADRLDIAVTLRSDFDAAETDANHPAVLALTAEVQLAHPSARVGKLLGTCDMRHYSALLGCPTVVFGPGDLGVAHAADEHVDLDEIMTAARALAGLALRGSGAGRGQGKR